MSDKKSSFAFMNGKRYGKAIVGAMNLMPYPMAKNFLSGLLSELYPCKKFLEENKSFTPEQRRENHECNN
jgi:hypothetical protein